MGYTYTPAYYSSLQDSITSICKSILPFSFKNPRLTAYEHKVSKLQSDTLKWQQNSFHQMLNLMGLNKEGIAPDAEVSAFRTHLLDTLIASKGARVEPPQILRDKLLFLQELLYAKCISAEEYHASKRPLLQRLAVQGAELEARDVIIGEQKQTEKQTEKSEEEWSEIDLRDEQSLNKEPKNKSKHGLSAVKHIKNVASAFSLGSFQKLGKPKEQKSIFDLTAASSNQFSIEKAGAGLSNNKIEHSDENPFWNSSHKASESETKSILMSESLAADSEHFGNEQAGFRGLADKSEAKDLKSAKKQWGFEGLKRWKKSNVENNEKTPLPLSERSSGQEPYTRGPDTKQIKRKLLSDGSPSGFFIDKVVGNNIKQELTRIQTELSSTNPNFQFSNDQMDAISTKLPVDKSDLKQFFPKSWCENYGDVVLDVVKKEFKDHVGEMETMRNATWERRNASSKRWMTFEDDENCHPNCITPR